MEPLLLPSVSLRRDSGQSKVYGPQLSSISLHIQPLLFSKRHSTTNFSFVLLSSNAIQICLPKFVALISRRAYDSESSYSFLSFSMKVLGVPSNEDQPISTPLFKKDYFL